MCFLKTAIAMVRARNYQIHTNFLLDEGTQCHPFHMLWLTNWNSQVKIKSTLPFQPLEHQKPLIRLFQLPQSFWCLLMVVKSQYLFLSSLKTPKHLKISHFPMSRGCFNWRASPTKNLRFPCSLELTHISLLHKKQYIWGPCPIAVKSKLGYVLSGPLYNSVNSMTSSVLYLSVSESWSSLETCGKQSFSKSNNPPYLAQSSCKNTSMIQSLVNLVVPTLWSFLGSLTTHCCLQTSQLAWGGYDHWPTDLATHWKCKSFTLDMGSLRTSGRKKWM